MKTIKLSAEAITKLFGAYDENVKFIEKELGVTIRTVSYTHLTLPTNSLV